MRSPVVRKCQFSMGLSVADFNAGWCGLPGIESSTAILLRRIRSDEEMFKISAKHGEDMVLPDIVRLLRNSV